MVLEDRGISSAVFQDLAAATVADARTIGDSSEHFCRILRGHDLGRGFHLASTLKCLENLGLDLTCSPDQQQFGDPFLSRARTIAMNHVLRGVKHGARIKVPDSWLLVGVADEGPAYERLGYQNVFCLNPFEIYGTNIEFCFYHWLVGLKSTSACVQSATDEEPEWVQGRCLLYRCPVVHPGDGDYPRYNAFLH
jgi:RNA-dependent RNA polymerase